MSKSSSRKGTGMDLVGGCWRNLKDWKDCGLLWTGKSQPLSLERGTWRFVDFLVLIVLCRRTNGCCGGRREIWSWQTLSASRKPRQNRLVQSGSCLMMVNDGRLALINCCDAGRPGGCC